jgi:hypothetical protein
MWMKNLWDFTRGYNQPGTSVPLPPYVRIAFTNPEMIRRIREELDLDVRVIGRCVEALIVSKLAADINSRRVQVGNEELACLSAILGTKSDGVKLLLQNPGAIEFTNMIFLSLDNFYSFTLGMMPSDISDVVQDTFDVLSQALLAVAMPLDQTDSSTNVFDGQCEPVPQSCLRCLKMHIRDLNSHGCNI